MSCYYDGVSRTAAISSSTSRDTGKQPSPRSYRQRQRSRRRFIAFLLVSTCWSAFWFLISMKVSSKLVNKLGNSIESNRGLQDFTDSDSLHRQQQQQHLGLTNVRQTEKTHIQSVPTDLSLSFSLDNQTITTSQSSSMTTTTSILPQWMTDYFEWHRLQRADLRPDNWNQHQFLVMQCRVSDNKCGGASDRLQVIPAAILLASQHDRILMIQWKRPAPLQEFLVPPVGGMDWTVPAWLHKKFKYKRRVEIMSETHFPRLRNNHQTLVQMRYQSFDHGSSYYDKYATAHGEPTFTEIYHACWAKLFQPSPPVQALITQQSQQLGLIPGQYVAVHARTLYYRDKTKYNDIITNAVNCASQLRPGQTIFVATDSNKVTKIAVRYGQQQRQRSGNSSSRVVARLDESSPLHLDRGSNFLSQHNLDWQNYPPESFYDIFVDLYLIAQSGCVTVNVGGFGHWGHLIGGDGVCFHNHAQSKCEWMDG